MAEHTNEDIDALFRCVAEYCQITAAVAFWYKPDSSHKHLYPTQKDDEGKPKKDTIDDEEQYAVCEYGIEILRTRRCATHFCLMKSGALPFSLGASFSVYNMCSEGSCCSLSRSVCMLCRDGPEGLPPLAPFATAVKDSSKPQFDVVAAPANVNKIMDFLKDRFTAAHRAQWKQFFDDYPH
eukprot:6193773-Pleurochrysis_carterae.AAC.1